MTTDSSLDWSFSDPTNIRLLEKFEALAVKQYVDFNNTLAASFDERTKPEQDDILRVRDSCLEIVRRIVREATEGLPPEGRAKALAEDFYALRLAIGAHANALGTNGPREEIVYAGQLICSQLAGIPVREQIH